MSESLSLVPTDDRKRDASAHTHDHGAGGRLEMGFAIASGLTYGVGLLAEHVFMWPGIVPVLCYLTTYVLGGFFTVASARHSVRNGRFEVDFLMLFAAVGAAGIGRLAEGAVLLFLFSLGHALEEHAMGRATRSVEALADLAPQFAWVIQPSGGTVERPTAALVPGDMVLIKPHTRIPSDGIITAGSSSVDQSSVTGESIPVDKIAADRALLPTPARVGERSRVYAGTVNGSGSLEVMVTATVSDNTLSRLVAMVRDAETSKSTTQRVVDRFQRIYVPGVLALVGSVFLFGLLVMQEPVTESFYRSMLVLVAASPCALAIATPAAVLAGVARAARAGLLVKGGASLENLGRVDVMAFDKTGTLTWGDPRLTDIVAADDAGGATLARIAYAVEAASEHPLAGAVTRGLADRIELLDQPRVEQLVEVPGAGVTCRIDGRTALVGNIDLFDRETLQVPDHIRETVKELQVAGRTTMVVYGYDRFLGVLGVMDSPRAEAVHVMELLRRNGVRELLMISGDNQQAAASVGRDDGVDQTYGELRPDDKVHKISQLTSTGRLTAMVGDGVNDAPALANATVGIAMGAASSAVAIESADIALMGDDIGRLPFLVRLSRASRRIIWQNLIAAMAIVTFLVPASLLGLAMGPVVLIHEGSTLLVVANALRLLRFELGQEHAGIDHEVRPVAA